MFEPLHFIEWVRTDSKCFTDSSFPLGRKRKDSNMKIKDTV